MPFLTSNLIDMRSSQMSAAIIAITIIPKNKPALKASSINPQPEREKAINKQNKGKINFLMIF
ncbi:MAG: hypothetical protein JWQ84_1971 [Mucilaginibacter sp.]|nr:hypothetical protein [Mucilaginibacter sp.]